MKNKKNIALDNLIESISVDANKSLLELDKVIDALKEIVFIIEKIDRYNPILRDIDDVIQKQHLSDVFEIIRRLEEYNY